MSDHSTVNITHVVGDTHTRLQVQFRVGNDDYKHYALGDRIAPHGPFADGGIHEITDGICGSMFWWVVIKDQVITAVVPMAGSNRCDEWSDESLAQLARLEIEYDVPRDADLIC